MRVLKSSILATAGLAIAAALLAGPVETRAAGSPAATVPIDVWALRDVVNAVQVSPDGKHILVHKTESKEGNYLLEIYDTTDLTKPPRRLNANPMEIISARWVSDNYIFGTAWQVKRKTVKGPEDDVRDYKTFAYNFNTNKFASVDENFSIVNLLPKEPNMVLVQDVRENEGGSGVDEFAAFRPRAYYRFNLETGARTLVLKGNEKYPTATFDDDGNPRFTSSVQPGSNELTYYYRLPGDGTWKEFGERYDLDEPENLYRVLGGFYGLVGFKQGDPNIGYVIDNRGGDKAGLYEFDFTTGQFGQKLFEAPDADVMNIQTSSMAWAGDNHLVAAIYPGEKFERHWFDDQEKALYESLEKQIPNAWQVSISSRSRDGKVMIVTNRGPHDPGSYWLVNNGKMIKLGSRNPLIKPDQLADVEFIRYPARDGRIIPAYVTKPKGEGPFPLIVLPHGGPHVNEVVSYDEWGQFLANNGYMVLQPEYRMSVGWGKSHFDSAYGQHGLAMQDDKDDGALYLVKQGMVDKNRIAMFGWSYGGYAALVAAERTPQIYQCTIAGAAVADPAKTYRQNSSPYTPKALDEWSKRRGMIGINPIADVAKVNVPIMMVHGSVDRRVEYWNFKDFKFAMEQAGKYNPRVIVGDDKDSPSAGGGSGDDGAQTGSTASGTKPASYQPRSRFVTLEGADHFYNTLMYSHQQQLYTQMLDFLKNDCGPGGL